MHRPRVAVGLLALFAASLGWATMRYPPALLAWSETVGLMTIAAAIVAAVGAAVWRRPLLFVAATVMLAAVAMRAVALGAAWVRDPSWVGAGAASGMALSFTALAIAWSSIIAPRPSTPHPTIGGRDDGPG